MDDVRSALNVKVKRLTPDAKLPTKAKTGDAGYDLYTIDEYKLDPGDMVMLRTGIAVEFPAGYAALLWDRSSLGAQGIHRLAGVIDSGYRGEWRIILKNLSDYVKYFHPGDRVAQVLFQKVEEIIIDDVTDLAQSERAFTGFGSSGA